MAKKPTADAENDVIELNVAGPAPGDTVPTFTLRLIGGTYAGDHADWPAGTTHAEPEHTVPSAGAVDVYTKADPLQAAPGLDTYVLQRTERVYGG